MSIFLFADPPIVDTYLQARHTRKRFLAKLASWLCLLSRPHQRGRGKTVVNWQSTWCIFKHGIRSSIICIVRWTWVCAAWKASVILTKYRVCIWIHVDWKWHSSVTWLFLFLYGSVIETGSEDTQLRRKAKSYFSVISKVIFQSHCSLCNNY